MKYYTKQWYRLLQSTDLELDQFEIIPDQEYTEAEVEKLYEQRLQEEIEEERRIYDQEPVLSYSPEDLKKAEKDCILCEEDGTLRQYRSLNQLKRELEKRHEKALQEFYNRPPFDPAGVTERFEAVFRQRAERAEYFPEWLQTKVGIYFIGLGILPEGTYKRLQEQEKENQINFAHIDQLAVEESRKYWCQIPAKFCRVFLENGRPAFEEAYLLSFGERDGVITLILRYDNWEKPGRRTPYVCIMFRDSELITCEINRPILCRPQGRDVFSDCRHIADELYLLEDGRYEYHLLVSDSRKLAYITIRCSDMICDENHML